MKKISSLVIGAIIIGSFSCSKKELEKLDVTFNLPTQEITFTVDTTSKIGELATKSDTIKANLEAEAKKNGTTTANVKSVKITKMTAFIDSPTDGNFDALDNASLTLSAPGESVSYIIGKIENVKDGTKEYSLTPAEGVDYLAFAKKPVVILGNKIKTKKAITKQIKMRIKIEYSATAGV